MGMKITKIMKIIKGTPKKNVKEVIPPPPIDYDRNNVTREEFQQYVHYLAKYKINKTFREPDRFVTEAERQERKNFREYVHYLAANNINRVFITK